jgi:hypothetical protein
MKRWMKTASLAVLLLTVVLPLVAAVTQIDLTTQVKGVLPTANGGTNTAFFTVAGPTAAHTYTFPDTNTTILTTNAAVTVAQGGTGLATLTAHAVVLGEGTSNVAFAAPSGNAQCFMSQAASGSTTDPSFQSCPAAPTYADAEVPSGTVNGVNAAFTLAFTPSPGASLELFKNGQLMVAGASADYQLATATATFNSGAIPKTGDVLTAFYRH